MRHTLFTEDLLDIPVPYNVPTLTYETPELNKNYWIIDDFFSHKDAIAIANQCLNKDKKKWKLGSPYTNELWPGMRAAKALKKAQLAKVEAWIKSKINKDKIWVVESDDVIVDSNTAILVGAKEGKSRPHVDNRKLCKYGAVLYLNQNPAPDSGTSFYRLKYANGAVGGNLVQDPYKNLVDALHTQALPSDAWYVDHSIENKFNRLILFKGNMVHSASSYFGTDKRDKRLAVTFFYMSE